MMMMSSSSSSSSATVRVEKATSDLLIGPDWTMNIDICDSINSNHWQGKEVVKAVKKRLQHKNPRVQLLALTLLETMVKNCGEYVHFQIAERNILQEMIKIVRKKTDMHVRDKILLLLDSWQEAFGGPGGKYPQYYWAYEELRRSGVEFPQRSSDAAPIFTPPVSHPTMGHPQAGYGMPSNSSRRLDEAMASEIESLSLSSLDSMRDVLELLSDMLQAVNASDRMAVKDEVIVDLVSQCRSNQKKLMQMLTSTGDEELLSHGLELNDSLQSWLARHDAIASGLPMPTQATSFSPQPTVVASSLKPNDVRSPSPRPNVSPSAPVTAVTRSQFEEEEEEEDDFAQLARRHSKPRSVPSQTTSTGTIEGCTSLISSSTTSSAPADPIPSLSNALTLPDPPAPVRTTKEQDMIDLLSITLSTTSTSPHTPNTPHTAHAPHSPHAPHTPAASQNMHQVPVASSTQGTPFASQPYPGNQGQMSYNSYVVPWAQPQPKPQPQPHPQPQPQYPQYSYPPPPWATTPGHSNNQSALSTATTSSSPQANTTGSYMSMQGVRALQSHNSFPAKGSNGSAMHGNTPSSISPSNLAPATGQKPFVPSYRLFEDLNVFGNADGRVKMTSSTSPSLSGNSGQGMVGGRK